MPSWDHEDLKGGGFKVDRAATKEAPAKNTDCGSVSEVWTIYAADGDLCGAAQNKGLAEHEASNMDDERPHHAPHTIRRFVAPTECGSVATSIDARMIGVSKSEFCGTLPTKGHWYLVLQVPADSSPFYMAESRLRVSKATAQESVAKAVAGGEVLYSTDEDAESFWCTSPEEAADEHERESGSRPARAYAWRRKVLTAQEIERYADDVIDDLEERITDDDWSNPEEVHRLEDGFRAALRAVVREHMPREHVWHCERSRELDVEFGPKNMEEKSEDLDGDAGA